MTGSRKRLIYLAMGIIAGLAAFAAVELLAAAPLGRYLPLILMQGAVLGLIFGFTFGFSDAVFYRELRRGLIKAGLAAGLGAVTVTAVSVLTVQGMLWSAGLLKLEYGRVLDILLPLWRSLGWMVMGMAVGSVDGIFQRSPRRLAAGVLGGMAGGLLGGLWFEFILIYLPRAAAARATGLIFMGGMIGLFLGELERQFSYARLRILNGPLKDREFLMVKKSLRLGRGVAGDLPVDGYEGTEGVRFLRRQGETFLLPVEGHSVYLNDREAEPEQILKYQDVIQAGEVKLLYLPR